MTVFRARNAAAERHAPKPNTLNEGSKRLATMMPPTIGSSAAYVAALSRLPCITSARNAVNAGLVAEMAWLKDTGMKRRDTFPRTTAARFLIVTTFFIVRGYEFQKQWAGSSNRNVRSWQ